MPPSNELTHAGEVGRVEPGVSIARQEPVTTLQLIREFAVDSRVDADKLGKLMELQERAEARDAEKQFNSAFAAAMIEMPRVAKRGQKKMGDKGTIMYATYDDVDAAVRPIETRHGFARSFATRSADKGYVMVLRLTHSAGHSITSERPCRPDPGPGRNEIQAEGSGESYSRRYLTLAVWNIVTVGADDDANSADPITEDQAMQIQEMLDFLAMEPARAAKFWAFVGGDTHKVEAIQRKDYERVAGALRSQCKAKEKR